MLKSLFSPKVNAVVFLILFLSCIPLDKVFSDGLREDFSYKDEINIEKLSPQFRLAFISGHVAAGIFLYEAGRLSEASKHLMHPFSETHKTERVGLEREGLDIEVFKKISHSIQSGKKADQVTELLKKAEENLILVSNRLTVDHRKVIIFLLETSLREYKAGVPEGRIIANLGEYQDSWGFVVIAKQHAEKLKVESKTLLIKDLNFLLKNWAFGPLEVEKAMSYEKMKIAITRILDKY